MTHTVAPVLGSFLGTVPLRFNGMKPILVAFSIRSTVGMKASPGEHEYTCSYVG